MSEAKLCPYRVFGETRRSMTIEGESYYLEKFMTCIGEDCAAYEDGECKRDVPAERTAEWMAFNDVDHKGRPTGRKILTCTNCNERESLDFGRRLPRYCSNCGRRMKGLFSVEKITMTVNGGTETL